MVKYRSLSNFILRKLYIHDWHRHVDSVTLQPFSVIYLQIDNLFPHWWRPVLMYTWMSSLNGSWTLWSVPVHCAVVLGVCQVMVDGLARIMCMNEVLDQEAPRGPERHTVPAAECSSPHTRKHSKEKKKIKCPELKYNKFQPPVMDYRDGVASSRGHPMPEQRSPLHNQALETDIREIKRILRTYMNRIHEKDAQGKIAKEWRIVARVLDRLFFFMYVSTIIVSLATIFPKGWHHWMKPGSEVMWTSAVSSLWHLWHLTPTSILPF